MNASRKAVMKYFNPLLIGYNDRQKILIEDTSLLQNGLMIIGAKNSGKSELIPSLFFQRIVTPLKEDGNLVYPVSNAGITVICSKKDQSFLLYAIAKKYHRTQINLLSPSTSFSVMNQLLGSSSFSYDSVSTICDYRNIIRKKAVNIIDMEIDRYGQTGIEAAGSLLLQLQTAMYNTPATAINRHYLIIDDAAPYLPYLDRVLRYGSTYNTIPILFFSSHTEFKDYEPLVTGNIQNLLLMPNLYYDDAVYYSKRLFLNSPKDLIGQKDHSFYSILTSQCERLTGSCTLIGDVFSGHERELLENSAARYRKTLRQGKEEIYVEKVQAAYSSYIFAKNHCNDPGSRPETIADTIAGDITAGTHSMADHFNYPGQFNVPASDNPYPSDFINTWESLLKEPLDNTQKDSEEKEEIPIPPPTETKINDSLPAPDSRSSLVRSESHTTNSILSGAFSVTEAESLCTPGDFSTSTVKSKKQKKPKKKKILQEYPSQILTVNESAQEYLKPVPASNPEIEEKTNSAESSATLDNDEVIDLFGMKSM